MSATHLCGEVHVVVGERRAADGAPQSAVLGAAEERHGVPPDLKVERVSVTVAAQPRPEMVERDLAYSTMLSSSPTVQENL